MPRSHQLLLAAPLAVLLAAPAATLHAQVGGARSAQRAGPLERRGLCGEGMLQFKIGGSAIGQETFNVQCLPDGSYAAGGRTELALPSATINVATTVTLDSALVPSLVTAEGMSGATAVNQRIAFGDSTVTVTANGQSRQRPKVRRAAWLGNNIYYSVAFLVARYDAARGGVQTIPTYPALPVTVQREGSDRVRASDTSTAITRTFDRYALRVGQERVVVWLDSGGKMALLNVPAQQFRAVRRGYEVYEGSLARTSSDSSVANAQRIDYGAPSGASFTASEVQIPVGGYSLTGTLLLPKQGPGPHPAAVLITGSGQQTRDETLPIAGLERYRPFRQIAEALAGAGVAVLRVDDRGAGQSGGGETVAQATTRDFAQDTRAQVAWLRARREIDPARIALIGHSEGAMIASMVAASDARIAAVAMLAGPGKPGEAVLSAQLDDLLRRDSSLTAAEQEAARTRQRDSFREIRARRSMSIGGKAGENWLRDFLVYDPLPTMAKVRQPLLILQGERDRQVGADNAALLASAAQRGGNADVTVRVLPTLNHLFLPSSTGAVTEYGELERAEVGEDVIGILRDWVTARTRVTR